MRTTQICVRTGLVATAAALPLLLAAPSAFAGGDLTVTATGSTVRATTGACTDGGTASLMNPANASFAGGQQAQLVNGSATWQNVGAGVYTVLVSCKDGTSVGPQTVTVGAAPTTSSTTAPARGVRGGLGGGTEDRGTLTLVGGGTLVAAAAAGGGVWYLRRRAAAGRT